MSISRRTLLQQALTGGAGLLWARALATGLPMSLLASPKRSLAQPLTASATPQRLILVTASAGHALNANAPGTYVSNRIAHPADPRMAATPLILGNQTYEAAAPWATLGPDVLSRSCFFHHTTRTNSHPNFPKVHKLMGAVRRQEMMVSMFAKALAPSLETVQTEPFSLAPRGLSFEGRALPVIKPRGLRDALLVPDTPVGRLAELRETQLDALHALFRRDATPAQRAYVDRLAKTHAESKNLSLNLLEKLSSLDSDGPDAQALAATVLLEMNISPVVLVSIPFSGDNHNDGNLARESDQTVSGMATLQALFGHLRTAGLQDAVTVAFLDVFGRTLEKKGTQGRDHNGNHHVMFMAGPNVRSSVVGGVVPTGKDWGAQAIASTTGAADEGGDIAFLDTLGAMGKTLGAALGIDPSVLDSEILQGKIVQAAVNTGG